MDEDAGVPFDAVHPFDRWPDLHEAVDAYFDGHEWASRRCSCGVTHYYKRGNDESCQTYDCLGEYRFLTDDRPRSFRSPREVWNEAESWLNDRGYPTATAAPVENEVGTTFLTVAGVQAFDDVFFEEAPASAAPALVAQPSIRTGARGAVGERDGVTTSFVNVATIRTDADFDAFVADVDAWLDLLSHLGLFVSDCSVVVDPPTVEDWGTGEFDKYALRFVYGGLELGEFGVLRGFPRATGDLTVVDCGFSLERIAWALNRTASFVPMLGPFRAGIHEPIEYLDAIRTLTLLAAAGVEPGPEGAGYRLRQLIADLVEANPVSECSELVDYYHAFWRSFAELSDAGSTRRRIRRERDRQYNRRLSSLPNAPEPDAETEAYVRELLDRGNDWREIRRTAMDPDSGR